MKKTYRVLLEYWNANDQNHYWSEEQISSVRSAGRIADDYLSKDRFNQLRSVEVFPL